jgi:pilus assembly protein CpaC
VIQPNGNIHLHVAPEVSTLDFADAVTVAGTTIPAISTRKADTEFELQDGQSFVIAGLMDNRVTNVANKIPGWAISRSSAISSKAKATRRAIRN